MYESEIDRFIRELKRKNPQIPEQQVRNRARLFMNFNGTAGVWRAECIRDAGNWQADTLTEDLDLSYRAQLRGWRFLYLNDLTVPAELPSEINGLKSQQFRWTKGAIETAKKHLPALWRADLPMSVKLAARTTNAALVDGSGRSVMVPANDRVEILFPAAAEMAGTARF